MHTKIHIGGKTLYLCDTLDEATQALIHRPDTLFIDDLDAHAIKTMIKEMEKDPSIQTGVFLHPDLPGLQKAFSKKFEPIQAGGGLVQNEKGETLLIYRRGFWDLPKGKHDEGETIEQCALREVTEETGLQNIALVRPLIITYHTYQQGTHHILKETHWFLMRATGNETLVPQTEEDILETKWVSPKDIETYKPLAYPSIVDVLNCMPQ
ncbi:MAG: NUDIX domain-containing protein [Niabella sp.]